MNPSRPQKGRAPRVPVLFFGRFSASPSPLATPFLQLFKQLITFKVQRQTGAKGGIWRGRFKMAALADAGALAGAMAFVDLLPVAQDGGTRPEESPFTSLHARVALYKGKFGATPYEPLAAPEGLWQPFPPEVAAELRGGEDAAAGMEPMPGAMPGGMGGMGDGMMGGAGTDLPVMPGMTGGMPMGAPAAPWVCAALREDGPGGALAWLPLRQYLRLLDTLVERAKAWPHVPADAPGRAPAPPAPAWESATNAALQAIGLQPTAFAAQWARWARLRL
jgi:hypothetical protein